MEKKRLKYPIGQQDFAKIRQGGFVFVDKTGLMYELVHQSSYVFLSRPRRFGKSLLLSTMKAYFEGRRELFEGLRVITLEKEWKKYPVLHLSFAAFDADDPQSLNNILENQFTKWEEEYKVERTGLAYAQRFQNIIENAFKLTGERVVILVDEYDHALINTLHTPEIHGRNRELLKSIYSNFKEMDGYIRFGFLTGVTRFSKAGIFSGLNNLDDISFSDEYSAICGFTEDEIKYYLRDGVKELGEVERLDEQEVLGRLKMEYDGYHFSRLLTDVYNPFSLLKALKNQRIDNYWIDSGTPGFLINKLKETEEPFSELFQEEADSSSLAAVDTAFTSPVALLYQTGYLTIKSYDWKENLYRLGVPNKEVREGFFSVVLQEFTLRDRMKGIRVTRQMRESLEEGRPGEFLAKAESFFAGIPYVMTSKSPEMYFENNLYVMLQMMGLDVRAEDETSSGRIDISVKTERYIYIIEIKKDASAAEALEQIERKQYALKYRNDGRQIIKIGVSFSSEKRNIESWQIS